MKKLIFTLCITGTFLLGWGLENRAEARAMDGVVTCYYEGIYNYGYTYVGCHLCQTVNNQRPTGDTHLCSQGIGSEL